MRLLVFTAVGLATFVVAYGLGLGGSVGSLIFLTLLFVGVLDRVSGPIRERLRA